MSQFSSEFWDFYIGVLTVVSIAACALLLWAQSTQKTSATETSGHVWDEDLKEFNNPLPRWWMWLFVITVVFAALYLVLYPGLGSYGGTLKWSSVGQYDNEKATAQAKVAPLFASYASLPAAQLASDAKAMALGERLFANNCATCHGADARGSKGFPNLTDGDWLWGGTPEKIEETITKGRVGTMPPMGAAVGTPAEVRNVAQYVLSLAGSPHDAFAASQGKAKFAACAACHGVDGKGNPALGAPNLTDKVWLHGWGEEAIVAMVNNGKNNEMPAHGERLSAPQIHVLAAYVWSLSNGKTGGKP
jgi:cytochrome c oxidase cbb3-type subunit 3